MPEYSIETSELTMRFGSVVAVDHVSFKVRRGEVFGFDVVSEGGKIRPRIGVVQQEPSYEHALSVEGNLDLYGFLWNVPKSERRRRVELLLDKFGLREARKTAPPELSIGQRRRLQVAREFMHDCELMFLDEPTTGLDPQAKRVTLDFVREKVRGRCDCFLYDAYNGGGGVHV